MERDWYTVYEVAELFRVHYRHVEGWIMGGTLRSERSPDGWRVTQEGVREFVRVRLGGLDVGPLPPPELLRTGLYGRG
jgi:excisionase family DNA binding protein